MPVRIEFLCEVERVAMGEIVVPAGCSKLRMLNLPGTGYVAESFTWQELVLLFNRLVGPGDAGRELQSGRMPQLLSVGRVSEEDLLNQYLAPFVVDQISDTATAGDFVLPSIKHAIANGLRGKSSAHRMIPW